MAGEKTAVPAAVCAPAAVLLCLLAAVMTSGRAALLYLADGALVILLGAALLWLLKKLTGAVSPAVSFLLTGALGGVLRLLMAAFTPDWLPLMGPEAFYWAVFLFCGPVAAALAEGNPSLSPGRVWLLGLGGLLLGLLREFLSGGTLFGVRLLPEEVYSGLSASFGLSAAGKIGVTGLFLAGVWLALWGVGERRLFPYSIRDGFRLGWTAALTAALAGWLTALLRLAAGDVLPFLGTWAPLFFTALFFWLGGQLLPRQPLFRDGILGALCAFCVMSVSPSAGWETLWMPAAAGVVLGAALCLFAALYARVDNIHLPKPFRTAPATVLLLTGALVAFAVI
jgi:hypothetical protein